MATFHLIWHKNAILKWRKISLLLVQQLLVFCFISLFLSFLHSFLFVLFLSFSIIANHNFTCFLLEDSHPIPTNMCSVSTLLPCSYFYVIVVQFFYFVQLLLFSLLFYLSFFPPPPKGRLHWAVIRGLRQKVIIRSSAPPTGWSWSNTDIFQRAKAKENESTETRKNQWLFCWKISMR